MQTFIKRCSISTSRGNKVLDVERLEKRPLEKRADMKTKKIPSPSDLPFFGWDEASIKAYCDEKPLQKGDLMIIYNGQGGLHEYVPVIVENASSGKQRRVILSKAAAWGGASFYRTGKNCFSPKGQSKMLPPIPELMQHLSLHCDVMVDGLHSALNASVNWTCAKGTRARYRRQ